MRRWREENVDQIPPSPLQFKRDDLEASPLADVNEDHFDAIDSEEQDAFLQEFEEMTDPDNIQTTFQFSIAPGDVIELPSTGSGPRLAVFVMLLGNRFIFLDLNGEIIKGSIESRRNIFITRSLFSTNELRLVRQYLPSDVQNSDDIPQIIDSIPQHVAAPIMRKLAEFRDSADDAYRKYASVLLEAHGTVAHESHAKRMTIAEIAAKVTGLPQHELTEPLLYAVSTSLLRDHLGFVVNMTVFAISRILWVESRDTVHANLTTRKAVRSFKTEQSRLSSGLDLEIDPKDRKQSRIIRSFLAKCRYLIQSFRASTITANGNILRHKSEGGTTDDKIHWNATDRQIILCLSTILTFRFDLMHPTIRSLPYVLMRATGMYEDLSVLDRGTGVRFLIEIGVLNYFTPTHPVNRLLYPEDQQNDNAIMALEEKRAQGESPLAAAAIEDSMQHLRRDWGNLPVYCVDSASTLVVDDGFSVEKVAGTDDEHWLHIHIAHPSAHAAPGSALAKLAERRHMSLFVSEGRMPLFPDWFNETYTLRPDAPALTYSARLNRDGVLLEHAIQPSIVRNVIRLTHSIVNEVLSEHSDGRYEAGDNARKQEQDHANRDMHFRPDGSGVNDLRTLAQISDSLFRQRSTDMFNSQGFVDQKRASVSVSGFTYDDDLAVHKLGSIASDISENKVLSPEVRLQFPDIPPSSEYKIQKSRALDTPSDHLVTEIMHIANNIAGKWAAERNMPMPYSGTQSLMSGMEERTARLLAMAKKDPSSVNKDTLYAHARLFYGRRAISSSPIYHRMLNFAQHIRVTSPLRRYYDLLAGWQIDAAILEEARQKELLQRERLDITPDKEYINDIVPFSHQAVDKILAFSEFTAGTRKAFVRNHENNWLRLALARSLYLGEDPALPNMRVTCFQKNRDGSRPCRCDQLFGTIYIPSTVHSGEDGNLIDEGDVWEVKISDVDMYNLRTYIAPLKRLSTGTLPPEAPYLF